MTAGLLSVPLGAISHLTAGRGQMGTSLSFHLFFAVLGVGLPLMMLIAEGMHLRTGDPVWRGAGPSLVEGVRDPVRRRSGVGNDHQLRAGAVVATVHGLRRRHHRAAVLAPGRGVLPRGGVRGHLSIRVGSPLPRLHWLSGFPIALASAASAFFIVTANAWMNVPRGFQIVHGRVTHVNVLAAMFNPAWATETTHMVLGAYLATTFGVAAVYAVGMLRGRRDSYHRKAITVSLSLAAIIAPLQLGVGDLLGRTVAQHQPATLAAIEGVTHTESGAGLNIGGIQLPGHATTVLNVKVPNLLSLLAYDRPNAPVRGLDTFPKADRTPLAWATRLAFIGMVGIGTGLVLLSLWYWLRRRRNGPGPEDRFTLLALAGAGPLAFLANELGWLVSEFGRQPWVVYGVFRTSNAITTASGLGATFTGFTLLYIALSVVTVWGVRRVSTGTPDLPPSAIVSVA